MAKRLAGKRWFEALGRRSGSLGRSTRIPQSVQRDWPQWARDAYGRGVFFQHFRHATKQNP